METEFSREYFERMASLEDKHPWTRAMRATTFTLLKTHALRNMDRVLDVGCGTGGFLRQWREEGAGTTVGADLYPTALELARDRSKAYWTAASAASLPFLDNSFDGLHCADVIQHLTFQESAFAFDEFARVLKPGGVMALRVGARRSFDKRPQMDYSHSYRLRDLGGELERRHLTVMFIARVNSLPSLWAELTENKSKDAPVKHIQDRVYADPRTHLLDRYLNWERKWLLSTGVSLPWGHTLIAIARKNTADLPRHLNH